MGESDYIEVPAEDVEVSDASHSPDSSGADVTHSDSVADSDALGADDATSSSTSDSAATEGTDSAGAESVAPVADVTTSPSPAGADETVTGSPAAVTVSGTVPVTLAEGVESVAVQLTDEQWDYLQSAARLNSCVCFVSVLCSALLCGVVLFLAFADRWRT